MKYGYVRPIVQDQQCVNQLHNTTLDLLIIKSHGLAKKRFELKNLLMMIEKEDELFV